MVKNQNNLKYKNPITYQEDLLHWVKKVVNKPYKSINGMTVCPYAMKAWRDQKVEVFECDGKIFRKIVELTNTFLAQNEKEIFILCDKDHEKYEADDLFTFCEMLNSPSGNIVNDIWLIPFHPNADKDASPIKGFDDTNYEPLLDYDFTMVFIQRLSQLNEASYFLEKKGYYDEWDKEDLTELHQRRCLENGNG